MPRPPLVLAALLAALVLAAPAAARTDGPRQLSFLWPADGTVTGPFGEWRGSRAHSGMDIGILRSLDVRAAAAGFVREAGTPAGLEGYGTLVTVEVAPGWELIYAHLASADVAEGDYVVAGQRLGTAGCTGWCTGTHLHLELRVGGEAVDPAPLFRLD